MTTTDGSVGWQQLREFAGIEVGESYVLSWRLDRDTLLIDADLKLRSDHPFYEPPQRREKACMRPAVIEFPFCVGIRHAGGKADGSMAALVNRLGSGAIRDLMRRDGGPYVLCGGFGVVEIDAERPILRLQGT